MTHENVVSRDRAPPDGRLPVGTAGGQFELRDDDVEDPIEDLVLVGDVVVDGHCLDAELLREPPHAERLDPALVCDLNRGAQHPVLVQADSWLRSRDGQGSHYASSLLVPRSWSLALDNLTA